MKKISALILCLVLLPIFALAWPPSPPPSIIVARNCSILTWFGTLCHNIDDGKIYKWSGSEIIDVTPDYSDVYQPLDADLTAIAGLAVTRGDLIVGNSTPAWTDLAKGTAGAILQAGADDIAWTAWTMGAPGSAGNLLKSDGTHWTSSNSIAGVTIGGFTAGHIPQVDGSGNLVGSANVSWAGQVTAPIVAPEVFIDCDGSADPYVHCTGAGTSTLTAALVSRTIINSYDRGQAQTVTLPTAAAGMTFIAIVGTQHNSAWKIQRGGSDTINFNGTASKTYFQETNQAVGSRVSCFTFKTGAAAWTWMCGSSSGTWQTD